MKKRSEREGGRGRCVGMHCCLLSDEGDASFLSLLLGMEPTDRPTHTHKALIQVQLVRAGRTRCASLSLVHPTVEREGEREQGRVGLCPRSLNLCPLVPHLSLSLTLCKPLPQHTTPLPQHTLPLLGVAGALKKKTHQGQGRLRRARPSLLVLIVMKRRITAAPCWGRICRQRWAGRRSCLNRTAQSRNRRAPGSSAKRARRATRWPRWPGRRPGRSQCNRRP